VGEGEKGGVGKENARTCGLIGKNWSDKGGGGKWEERGRKRGRGGEGEGVQKKVEREVESEAGGGIGGEEGGICHYRRFGFSNRESDFRSLPGEGIY